MLPAALIFVAAVYATGGDMNVFARHLVDHLNLTGNTATLVQNTLGGASSDPLGATLTMVVTFLLCGNGIGQLHQDVYARAWSVEVASPADQALYAIFFVFAGVLTLVMVGQAELGDTGRLALLVPAWLIGLLAQARLVSLGRQRTQRASAGDRSGFAPIPDNSRSGD